MKRPLCLGIEATGVHLGLALSRFDRAGRVTPVATFFKEMPLRQSAALFPTLTTMLRKRRLQRTEIGLIGVDVGPGSFTGVRVGVAAARALAQGLDVPGIGVSALEAMARQAAKAAPEWRGYIGTCRPALADEAYFAVYRPRPNETGLRCLVSPRWRLLSDMEAAFRRRSPLLACGDRTDRFRPRLAGAAVRWTRDMAPRPEIVAELAIEAYLKGPASTRRTYRDIRPLYLQPSWAERTRMGSK